LPRASARFSATAREYCYRIEVGEVPDPFTDVDLIALAKKS